MARVQVAYEQAHECKEGCNCAKDSGYLDAVQASLADLGSDDPAGDVARHAKYVRGAQKARLEPKQAAAMILAMSRPDEGYQPRYRFEDVAETAAHEYIAVDSRGKKVFGPTDSFDEAKLHARRAGGVVKFEMGAKEAPKPSEAAAPPPAAAAAPTGLQPGSRVTIETPLRPVGSGGSGHPKLGYVVKLGKRGVLVATADGEEWYPIDRLTPDGYVSPDYARELPYERPIRFHRGKREGTYEASAGHMGTMVCSQRSPNRRANPPVLPWVVMIKRVEIAQASTKLEAYGLAAEYAKNPKAVEEPPAAAEEGCAPVIRDGMVERPSTCMPSGIPLEGPEDVWKILKERTDKQGVEGFWVLGSTIQQEMVGDKPVMISLGQTSGVRVDTTAVYAAMLGLCAGSATTLYCAHNHPSGTNHRPSEADKKLTKAIKAGFDKVFPERKFGGHVVCSMDGYTVAD
jgi:hypothetical protein